MEEFLRQNIFSIIALGVSIGTLLFSLGRKDAKAEEQDKKITALEQKTETIGKDVDKVCDDLAHHRENIDRHVDPNRDSNRWADLLSRIDRIDRKLEQINAKS